MYKDRENRLRKIVGICCMLFLLTGCDNTSEVYVKQQMEDSELVTPYEDGQSTAGSDEISELKKENDELSKAVGENDSEIEDSSLTLSEYPKIYVQVSGAVKHPGVYQLEEGSRIFQAVELAGGVTEEADINSINQAKILSDGQMVYVYAVGEQINPTVSQEQQDILISEDVQSDGRVNLNTATVEELQTLPGIGQSKAESIISYREEHGAFESIEGLMDIPGIKEGVFSKIKDHIKVN